MHTGWGCALWRLGLRSPASKTAVLLGCRSCGRLSRKQQSWWRKEVSTCSQGPSFSTGRAALLLLPSPLSLICGLLLCASLGLVFKVTPAVPLSPAYLCVQRGTFALLAAYEELQLELRDSALSHSRIRRCPCARPGQWTRCCQGALGWAQCCRVLRSACHISTRCPCLLGVSPALAPATLTVAFVRTPTVCSFCLFFVQPGGCTA